MEADTVISMVVGTLIGGLITLGVALVFHWKASKQLRREAEIIKHYVNALIGYLEEAGYIKARRDEAGNLLAPVGKDTPPLWEYRRARQGDDAGESEPTSGPG